VPVAVLGVALASSGLAAAHQAVDARGSATPLAGEGVQQANVRFGIAAGGKLHELGDDELGRELDFARSAGSRWLRADLNWEIVQHGGPQSFDWTRYDRIVEAARSRGLRVLLAIVYTPEWARPGTSSGAYPPVDLRTYAAFCRAAVARYSARGVGHWEIWNEPNLAAFWKPAPSPTRYAAMLRLAYAAIKRADPKAFVVSGGLAPYGAYGQATRGRMNPLTFLQRMYAARARGSFDALGWHPYNFGGLSFHRSSAWSQVLRTTPSVRSLMSANRDARKPVWATEFGSPTGTSPDAVSEAAQAQLVRDGFARWRTWSFAGPLFWYTLRDAGRNPADREDNFGLLRRDFSAKPSFSAYQAASAG
jgi:polysaccharide biosynthesis protein PslG